MKLTLHKFRFGSPLGLLTFQSLIVGVKKTHIGVYLISLESYQNVDVKNDFAWAIWTSTSQVMARRKVGSQTDSLTFDH